jgi:alpha-galactosidase
MSNSVVLQQHPDWAASVSDNYFGAQSLCLANKPTRDWVVAQAVRMIDDYNLDYILQDGQNMVKKCTRTDHTHDSLDSNYSNAVDGIDWVVEEVERQRPNVLWENCEDGGNMMTFSMVRHYATSITNDASGALGSRQGVWGATYPFPPRYTDRYMPEDPSSAYITRSYMFGGPWHLMNRLVDMDSGMAAFAQSEIQTYKQIRGLVMKGQVFHLSSAPDAGRTDALESYSASDDAAVVVVTRDGGASATVELNLQGLSPGQTYRVRFKDDHSIFTMTGQQLMQDGVKVTLPQTQSAEIVFVEPANQ